MLHRFSPDGNYPWALQGEGTGLATAYEESLRDSLNARAAQNPSLKALPSRLYDPNQQASFQLRNCSPSIPEYVVISYTWGRWRRKTRDQDTTLEGGHWRVPANERFSRDHLDTAVARIASGRCAWLDVFCIPQDDNDPEKAVEIAKQSAIFRSAARAAVWLGTGGEEALVEICSWVPEVVYMVPTPVFDLPNRWIDPTSRDQGAWRDPETWRRMKVLAEFTKSLVWASSLWTLQEAALRPDAAFYDRQGSPLLHPSSGNHLTIKHLRNAMRTILDEITDAMEWDNGTNFQDRPELWSDWGLCEEDVALLKQALKTIKNVSLHKLGTMNASELLLASRHRTASREHDRVYGIMGAIGVAMPTDYKTDAKEVINRFWLKLHQVMPVEVQAFYRDAEEPRSSGPQWLLDEDASLLTVLRQRAAPSTSVFSRITDTEELVVTEIQYLGKRGLAELKGRLLSHRATLASDRHAFVKFLPVKNVEWRLEPSYICLVLDELDRKADIALVHLGTISGLEHRGLHNAYLAIVSDVFADSSQNRRRDTDQVPYTQCFTRMGLIITTEPFLFTAVQQGTVLIK